MAKQKKPAPKKGGAKKAAPKKAIKRAIKKAEKAIAEGRVLTERQADQLAADKMRADSFASTQPKHPTVEEQWAGYERLSASMMSSAELAAQAMSAVDLPPIEYTTPAPKPKKPSLWSRFRSAVTGLFVSKQYAEANPDTTVRERVK